MQRRTIQGEMTSKQTTINTLTLTCSNCGSGQFTKLATNEYRCNHCNAVTLVEDDVAQRLEKILRGMQQQPAAAAITPRTLVMLLAVMLAALVLIPTVASLIGASMSSRTPARVTPSVDLSRIKLTDLREVRHRDGSSREKPQLVMLMRNETDQIIDTPRVTASFYQDELTLPSSSADPLARILQPGEYAPVLVPLPDKPFSRYELKIGTAAVARKQSAPVTARKVQLVRNGGRYRLVGLVSNAGTTQANSIQILVMLYDDAGTLIGTGNGYGAAHQLDAGGTSTFDVSCDMLSDANVAAYEYLVQSNA